MKIALKLALICGVSAALIVFVNSATQPIIQENAKIAEQIAYKEIIDFDELDVTEIEGSIITSQAIAYSNDEIVGYVYIGQSKNSFGDITAMVLVNPDGDISDVNITNYNQTLGADIVNTDTFLDKFIGSIDDIESVDTKVGATYAANSTKEIVSVSSLLYQKNIEGADVVIPVGPVEVGPADFANTANGTYEGVSAGFSEGLKVNVVVKDGIVIQVVIVENNETTNVGGVAFDVVTNEIIETNSTDVDTVSGATMTSNGIIDAVNKAVASEKISDSAELIEVIVIEPVTKEALNIEDGSYNGTAEGYGGELNLTITVEGGYITSVDITKESEERGAAAIASIVDEIIENNSLVVDTISGSTITSHAIMSAGHNALRTKIDLKDGTYLGSAHGYMGNIAVEVTVEDGYITVVDVTESVEEREAEMDTVIENIIETNSIDVDTIAGATVSSKAVMTAVKDAINIQLDIPDGVYLGSGNGFAGPVEVEVEVESGYIVRVDVLSHKETYTNAITTIPERIVASNSTKVDTVSGNTLTSKAIINAVDEALGGADNE